MLYILLGIIVLCALLCLAELIVRVWEKAEQTARRAAAHTAVRLEPKAARAVRSIRLPDREAVKIIYSISDQFADHFREVMSS